MKEHFKSNQNFQLPIALIIIFISSFYGQDVANWLKVSYPSIYNVMVILTKTLIAVGPIVFLGYVYLENKVIIKRLKHGNELPKRIQNYYGKYIESYNTKILFIIAWVSLIAMVLWALFMLFLFYQQGANFLNLPQ